MKASKCFAAARRLILSISRPWPSGEAGELRVPVGVMPVRRMIQSPAGTSQRSVPSRPRRSVRSTVRADATARSGSSGSGPGSQR